MPAIMILYSFGTIKFYEEVNGSNEIVANLLVLMGWWGIVFYCFGLLAYKFIAASFSRNVEVMKRGRSLISDRLDVLILLVVVAYAGILMTLAAGSPLEFLRNSHLRHIYMQGITSLIVPLFLMKILVFRRLIIEKELTKKNAIFALFAIAIFLPFGRFLAVLFLLQLYVIYSVVSGKRVGMLSAVFFFLIIIGIVFGFGLHRFYLGLNEGQTFYDFIKNMDYFRFISIMVSNFFDTVDVFDKVFLATSDAGHQFGLTFFVSTFKVVPRLYSDFAPYFIGGYHAALIKQGLGAQVIGFFPELYANFNIYGVSLFFFVGLLSSWSCDIKAGHSWARLVGKVILYFSFIQLMRNGSAVFVTFLFSDLLCLYVYGRLVNIYSKAKL